MGGFRGRLTFVVAALAVVAVACPPDPGPPTGDTTPPVLSLPAPIDMPATSVFGATVTYTASASDAVSGPVTPVCTPASGTMFPVATTTVSCSATDAAGNTANGTFTVTVRDTTPPTVTVPHDIAAEATGPSGATVSFSATAVDGTDGALTPTCTPASGSVFGFGTTTVTCSATDAAGNTGTASFPVTVSDTTAPTLNIGDDLTVEATGPAGAAVTYSATATDAVDPTPSVSCTPPSGTPFGLGATPVSCTASDAAGNTAVSGFNVTVEDTTGPALSLPADFTVEATGPAGAAVTWIASAADLVDGTVGVTCTPSSGTTFALGATTVNCSATDTVGNSTNGSFVVTVVDATGPVLTLPDPITTPATSGDGAPVSYEATATDLVDPTVSVDCVPPSGSTFAVGETTVDCSATDDAGNPSTGSFTVTVVGDEWLTPACYSSATVNAAFRYFGPESTLNNAEVFFQQQQCFGDPAFSFSIVRVNPSTAEQAAIECAALQEGLAVVTFVGAGFNVPADAWACFPPPPPQLWIPDDFRVGSTGPDGATVGFPTASTASSEVCDPPSGSLFPLGPTLVECAVDTGGGGPLTDSFTLTVDEGPLWADGGCYASATGDSDLFYNGYENTAGNGAIRPSLGGVCAGAPPTTVTVIREPSGDGAEITALCLLLGSAGGYFKATDHGYALPDDAYVCTA